MNQSPGGYVRWPDAHGVSSGFVAASGVTFGVFPMLWLLEWQGSANTHTLMELSATLLALVTGGMALVRFYSRPELHFLVLGAGLVGVGLLDGFHALLSTAGLGWHLPSAPESLVFWSRFASRIFFALLLFLCWTLRQDSRMWPQNPRQYALPVFVLTGAAIVSCFLLFALVPLPVAHIHDWLIPRPEEFIAGLFFLLALRGFYRERRWQSDRYEYWLVVTLLLSCMVQWILMPMSKQLYDAAFDAAHLVKILSYLALLTGLFTGLSQRLQQTEKETFERRQTETRLDVTESRLRLLFELSPVGIAMTSSHSGRFLEVNDALLVMTGYSHEECLALCYEEVVAVEKPRDEQDKRASLESAARFGPFESVLTRKDGSSFPVLLSGVRVLDESGEEMIWLIAQDISIPKTAELALMKDREFLKTVLDNLSDGVVACDENGTLNLFNNAAFMFHGLAPEALTPEQWSRHYSLFKADGQTPLAQDQIPLLRAQAGEVVRDAEVVIAPAGLPPRLVLCSGQPISTPDGQPLGAVVVMHDISERKQAEQQVQELNTRLELATQAAKVGIWDYRFDSRLVIWDANMHDLHGMAQGGFDGTYKRWMACIHPDDQERTRLALDLFLAQGETMEYELRILLPGGEVRWIKAFAILSRDEHGQPLRMTGTNWDISASKRNEQLKNEFISTVSHELRTPLTSISGSLGLLVGGVVGELPAKAKPLLDIAQKNSQRLIHLINDLLDIEKISAGKMSFNYQTLEIRSQVEKACENNQGYAGAHGVTLQVSSRLQGLSLVRADEQRLQQILANFISNAIKFSPKGGTVELAVCHRDDRVRIEVRDQGCGIPRAFRAQVFQKFAQADASDTRSNEGTGLGLAICKELADNMGGLVSFESTEGEGSCFFVEFDDLRAETDEPARKPRLPAGAPRVLVVDDEAVSARLISLLLYRAGVASDVASSGKQALAQLRESRYDAMTLDLMLPDIPGSTVIRRVREWEHVERRQPLPILVVSGSAQEGRLEIDGDVPLVDWFSKPIDERRLMASLGRMLRQGLPAGIPAELPRILHVEDDADLCEVVKVMARQIARLERAGTLAGARTKIGREAYDLVILDLQLPDGSGWMLLPELKALAQRPRILLLSATDVSYSEAQQVDAVLLKSRVSQEDLLDALRQLLQPSGSGREETVGTERETEVPLNTGRD